MSLTIVWFRRDLRLADNPALSRAVERGDPLLPVYLQDWEKGSRWSPGVAARWWLTASLRHLSADLDARGVALQFLSGDPVRVLPDLAVALGAGEVAWNALLEPYALDLDRRVRVALETLGVRARTFSGPVLFEPEEHLSRAGRPFVQFGAFWRSCLALPEPRSPLAPPRTLVSVPEDLLAQAVARDPGPWRTVASAPGLQQAVAPAPGLRRQPDPVSGRVAWQPGEEGARRRLDRFLKEALADYATARDYPAVEGVSRLSPHLHFGEITPQQVWHTIREVSGRPATQPRAGTNPRRDLAATQEGADAFLRQLGWREFGHYLLYHFPTIASQPFRPEFSRFPWHEDPEGLAAWKEGLTGFPLVDAGMRQLVS